MDYLASRNSCRSSAFSAAWSDGVLRGALWLLRAAMCVRELNFRLLLRGLRADRMFAYRSKSSRVCSPHAHVIPHGALRFDWVCAKCIAGFRDKTVCDGIYTETLQLRGDE